MKTSSSNTWLLSLKVAVISTAVVSAAVALKLSAPAVSDIVASQVPSLWSSALSWLRPPYLYILINCVIISIVASSKLHPKSEESPPQEAEIMPIPPPVTPVKISEAVVRTDYSAFNSVVLTDYGYDVNSNLLQNVSDSYELAGEAVVEARAPEVEKKEKLDDRAAIDGGDEAVVSRPVRLSLQRKESMEFWLNENQRPPVSSRIGNRKSVKSSPEGVKSLLGVAKPKRQDTLESTWKTITDGRSMPLTRHLKKSDTWDTQVRRMDENTPPKAKTNKSETFQGRSSRQTLKSPPQGPSVGPGRLRKEPSLSQDELNRRVEEFIKKFNEEMRLQRQESLNQYQEMVAPLAH